MGKFAYNLQIVFLIIVLQYDFNSILLRILRRLILRIAFFKDTYKFSNTVIIPSLQLFRVSTVSWPCRVRDRTVPWPCQCLRAFRCPLSVSVSPERVRVSERVGFPWACSCYFLSYYHLIWPVYRDSSLFKNHAINKDIFSTSFSSFLVNHDSCTNYLWISFRGFGFGITSIPD